LLQADGAVLGSSPASRRFRNQKETFSVSADGTIIDFSFEGGKSPFRFDLRALKLSDQRPADGRTPQPNQNGDRRLGHLPYGVDARTLADLKAPAISADEFHHKAAELAKYGRVLVLLPVIRAASLMARH
jgi:hypothetical protein